RSRSRTVRRVRRPLALACLATIVGADYVIRRRRPRWIVVGMLDEPAHVATAGLILLNLPLRSQEWPSREWTAGYLAGSLLPDLDHVPLALRAVHPDPGDPRPVTHCLLAVAPMALWAARTGSATAKGAAAGMLAHFVRDLGIGTGAPLLWPATSRHVRVPYSLYAAGCLLLGRRATLVDGL
ncbi:MAG: metal-dependent hydrolase, partial [Thermoleophilaceae bacterium]